MVVLTGCVSPPRSPVSPAASRAGPGEDHRPAAAAAPESPRSEGPDRQPGADGDEDAEPEPAAAKEPVQEPTSAVPEPAGRASGAVSASTPESNPADALPASEP